MNDSEGHLVELIAGRLANINGKGFKLSDTESKRLQKLLDDIRVKRDEVYSVLYARLSGWNKLQVGF